MGSLYEQFANRGAAGIACPSSIDAVKQIVLCGRASDRNQCGFHRAAGPRRAVALAAVEAAADSGKLAVTIADQRIVTADFQLNLIRQRVNFLLHFGSE